jgi:integrase
MRTLSDVADEFLAYQKIYTEDPDTTAFNLRIIKRYLGPRLLKEVTFQDIERMIAARIEDGIARSTINRQGATLSKLFTWSIDRGYHPGPNPMRKIKKFRESPGRIRWLTGDEASRLILAAAHHLKPIIIAALHTGGRLGELLSLLWSDIDFDRGIVVFRKETTKSGKERQVPLSPELAATLKRLRPGPPDQTIFEYNGHNLVSVRTAFLRACKKAGLGRDVVFHTLRHTFASWWVMKGGDPYRLQKCLGHSSMALTQRYSHLSPDFIRDGVQFIGPPAAARNAQDEQGT